MENFPKCPNIYINPSFGGGQKSVIHINPKVHKNTAIHVNPKMVNTIPTAEIQQRLLEKSKIEQALKTYANETCNVQKSVHVNPKLMQKLKKKVAEKKLIDQANQQKLIQPKIVPAVVNTLSTHSVNVVQNSIIKKNLSSSFVTISKNKLVRIRPETKKPILSSPTKKISPLKKVDVLKISSKTKESTNLLKATSRNTKYKIDRTAVQKINSKPVITSRKPLSTNSNLINIDGVLYRSSKSCLVRSTNSSIRNSPTKKGNVVNGKVNTSLISARTKKVRKHSLINGRVSKPNTSLRNSIGRTSLTGQKSNYKHVISNRVKQRSLQILRLKMCKNNQPCLLFQRFGYCAKYIDGNCPKVHDKKQVALCKNFLQGKCLLDNCSLSHEVGPEKMPTCKYFLEGCCTRDTCQYLHVKVSANTPICVPFLRGYCAKGDKCKERHTNLCPEFDKTGKCPKGKNCPYPHKYVSHAQQKSFRIHKKANSFTKPKENISQSIPVEISSRDENKKRYYDESDCVNDNNLEEKRIKLSRQMNIIASIHAASNSQPFSVNENHTEMKSQLINTQKQSKRPPMGHLPSYIPIN